MPARVSRAEEQRLVAELVAKVLAREARSGGRARAGDTALMKRARELSAAYLDGLAQPVSVRWVTNMTQRWGSCTPSDGTIRLSHRLAPMPTWVIDYVLVHELSHLIEAGHGPRFWNWVARYPSTERARGFLEGVALAAHFDAGESPSVPSSEDGSCVGSEVDESMAPGSAGGVAGSSVPPVAGFVG